VATTTKKKAKRKKPKPFRAVTAVKAMARALVGPPPPTRRVPGIHEKEAARREKHKPTLQRLINEEGS